MKLRVFTLSFLLLLTLACCSCKQTGERPLWLDDAVEEFVGSHENDICCTLDRDEKPCLRLYDAAGSGEWQTIRMQRGNRIPVKRFVQISYYIQSYKQCRSAPAIKAVRLDIRRHPLSFIPSTVELNSSNIAMNSVPYDTYKMIDGYVCPLIPIVCNIYSVDRQAHGRLHAYCVSPRIKALDKNGRYSLVVDKWRFETGPVPREALHSFANAWWISRLAQMPVTEENCWLTPDGDLIIWDSTVMFNGHNNEIYFDGKPLFHLTKKLNNDSGHINIEPKLLPYSGYVPILGNEKIDNGYHAMYYLPVKHTVASKRSIADIDVGNLILTYRPLVLTSPVIDLGPRVRYLAGYRLDGDIPEGSKIDVSIRSVDPNGTGSSREGTYISTPRTGTGNLNTDDCIGRIRWRADVPGGAGMKVCLRQGDDGLVWGDWKEYDNGGRLPEIKKYQQYKITMKRSPSGASPQLYGIGISVCPLIESGRLALEAFDPSGDNEGRDAGRLQWKIGLNAVSHVSLEIMDQRGIVICRPYNCKLLKPGKRELTFYGLVDYAPLPQGSYGYRVTATQKGFQQPMAVREGKFMVQYHLGNCRCRVPGGDEK
ncbi:MAG: hypothetical protein PHT33_08670 [bacterium]|nr:hypothetical protein [bacterium]